MERLKDDGRRRRVNHAEPLVIVPAPSRGTRLWPLIACGIAAAAGARAVAGPLITARTHATATKLQNGKVLVAGGFDASGGVLRSAELFDPSTNNFTAAGNMTVPRVYHTATLLQDGRVLIAGGSRLLRSAEVYDPATSTFTAVGNMVRERENHVAVLLSNGKVLVSGGSVSSGGYTKTAELFDPVPGNFTSTGEMVIERSSHVAVRLGNGNVFVCGGSGRAGGQLGNNAEQYNVSTGTWSPLGDMIKGHGHTSAVLLSSGKVYIVGGKSSEVFDPVSGSYTAVPGETPPPGTGRWAPSTVKLNNGNVLVFGGALDDETDGYNNTQFKYSESNNDYMPLLPVVDHAGRADCPAVLLDSGSVLIVGGHTGVSPALGTAILYDPSNDTFSIP